MHISLTLCRRAIISTTLVVLLTTDVQAQNWTPLTGRSCQPDMPQATGIQPFFILDSTAIKLDASSIGQVMLSTTVPTGNTYPFDAIRKALFVPQSGLAIESDAPVMLQKLESITAPSHGYIKARLFKDQTYRVVLFVEDEAMVTQCDTYYVYSIGDITTHI